MFYQWIFSHFSIKVQTGGFLLLGEIVKLKHFSSYWSDEDLEGTVVNCTKTSVYTNAYLKLLKGSDRLCMVVELNWVCSIVGKFFRVHLRHIKLCRLLKSSFWVDTFWELVFLKLFNNDDNKCKQNYTVN